jgi:hypothetical protein
VMKFGTYLQKKKIELKIENRNEMICKSNSKNNEKEQHLQKGKKVEI